jgi:DNA-binding FadR family transcriptional regulator
VAELFEARIVLETTTAAKAARLVTQEDIEFLTELSDRRPIELFAAGVEGPDNSDVALTNDAMLHRRIAMIAGNKIMVELLDGLNKRASAYRTFMNQRLLAGTEWNPTAGDVSATVREHAAIVRALKHGDPDKASAAMRRHLSNASRRDIDSARTVPESAGIPGSGRV